MNPSVIKVKGNEDKVLNRPLPNLTSNTEVGINVPLLKDYKFLTGYHLNTVATTATAGSIFFFLKTDPGLNVPDVFIEDFDGNLIDTCYIGPTESVNNKEAVDYRPGRTTGLITAVDKNILGDPDSLGIELVEDDDIILSGIPDEMQVQDETLLQVKTNYVARRPLNVNVKGHANSLMGNLTATEGRYLVFPITARGSIDPVLIYRFSFYYRVQGEVSVSPAVQWFTDTGVIISSDSLGTFALSGADTEKSDFRFFEILLPSVSIGATIPQTARRMKILLFTNSLADAKFEIIYPIMEHNFNSGITPFTMIPEAPSAVNIDQDFSSVLKTSTIGKKFAVDTTKLFALHLGRNFYNYNLSWSLADSNTVDELAVLENFNERGFSVVFRLKHHDAPPVVIGNIKMERSNPTYNYNYNDIDIEFDETN